MSEEIADIFSYVELLNHLLPRPIVLIVIAEFRIFRASYFYAVVTCEIKLTSNHV